MNEIDFDQLKRADCQRPLTTHEKSALEEHFAAHPESRAEFELELALSQSLRRLPNVAVSSNFTRLVVQAAEKESRSTRAKPIFNRWMWLKEHWLRSTAVAGVLVCVGILSAEQYRSLQRIRMAQGVSAVSQAATFPQQWLVDFEAINRFDQPPVDNELLAALQ